MTEKIASDIWSFKLDPAYQDSIELGFSLKTESYPYQLKTKQFYCYHHVKELPGEIEVEDETCWMDDEGLFNYIYEIDAEQEIPNYYDHIDIQIQYTLEVPEDSDDPCEPDPETGGYPFDVSWFASMELTDEYNVGTKPFPDDIIESDNSDVQSGNLKDYSTLIQRFYGRALKRTRPATDDNKFVLPSCKFTFKVKNNLDCDIGFSNIITKIAFLYYEDSEKIEEGAIEKKFPLFSPDHVRMSYMVYEAIEGNLKGWPVGSKWFIVNIKPISEDAIEIFDTVTGALCNGIFKEIVSKGDNLYSIYYQLFVDFDNSISSYLWNTGYTHGLSGLAYDYATLITGDGKVDSFYIKINENDINKSNYSDWIQISDGTKLRFADIDNEQTEETEIKDIRVFKFGKDEDDINFISLKYNIEAEYEASMNVAYTRFASCHVWGEDYFYDPPDDVEL